MAIWDELYVHLRDPNHERFCSGSAETLNHKIAENFVEPQKLPFFPPQSLQIMHDLVT